MEGGGGGGVVLLLNPLSLRILLILLFCGMSDWVGRLLLVGGSIEYFLKCLGASNHAVDTIDDTLLQEPTPQM